MVEKEAGFHFILSELWLRVVNFLSSFSLNHSAIVIETSSLFPSLESLSVL